ncbi:MAG: NADPH-dependent 7-cyano-7-deazaguanine reductase QueF [Dokdonella sp.]
MNNTVHDSALGKSVLVSNHYNPDLLFPIPRAAGREVLGLGASLPFDGVDIWNAYELSWLDARGKPQVAVGEFRIPASSPNLIESKSFKLYLNSINQTRYANAEQVRAMLAMDLSAAAGAEIGVELSLLPKVARAMAAIESLAGDCIDDLNIEVDHYGPPKPELLGLVGDAPIVDEALVSHLLKSNCPVTGQPDWASVQISYAGRQIDRTGLLRYLVSYRNHDDFHEQCVERIFSDILARCAPQHLTVYARYTRRGGLDINPWRSTEARSRPDNARLIRQ